MALSFCSEIRRELTQAEFARIVLEMSGVQLSHKGARPGARAGACSCMLAPRLPPPSPPPQPLPPSTLLAVLDLLMYVFGTPAGTLDPVLFIEIMKRRTRVPGTRVRRPGLAASRGEGGGRHGAGGTRPLAQARLDRAAPGRFGPPPSLQPPLRAPPLPPRRTTRPAAPYARRPCAPAAQSPTHAPTCPCHDVRACPRCEQSFSVEADGSEEKRGFPLWWACIKQCTNNED